MTERENDMAQDTERADAAQEAAGEEPGAGSKELVEPQGGPTEGASRDGDTSTEVAELRQELESLNDRHLRLAAEFDNYRKRNQREREGLASRLQADLVSSLLDVLDDLQRVEEGGEEVEAEAVREGVRLVEKKLVTVLEGAGLTTVDAEGARFDPELMEALGVVPTDDPAKDGTVADVFQRGYQLQDRLLRPARVRVYNHEEAE
jgi:molecular chaperone GrpE